MKGKYRILLKLLILFSLTTTLNPQTNLETPIPSLEFRNKPLTDVLLAMGEIGGLSILPDETVTGNITYRFTETSLNRLMALLSQEYGLFFDLSSQGTISVSRVKILYKAESNLLTFKANQVDVSIILKKLSCSIRKTILFDPMPEEQINLYSQNVTPARFLSILLTRFPDYKLIEDPDYFYIKKIPETEEANKREEEISTAISREESEDSYTINLERGDLFTILDELFKAGEREYALLYKSSSSLQNLEYRNRSFDEMLSLLLIQSGGDYTVSGGTYFIYEINRQDILKRFKLTEYIQLEYLSAEDIPGLLPSALSSTSFYKIDKNRNGIILSGSMEETLPVKNHILALDVPPSDRKYYPFTLNYLEPSSFIALLPKRLTSPPPLITPEGNSFLSLLTPNQYEELTTLKAALDIPCKTTILTFRYLKAGEFLKSIPPPFTSHDFVSTGNESSVYFKGSDERWHHLRSIIDVLDTPKPQVRYKLLIIQYQKSHGLNHEISLSANLEQPESETAFLGTIGNILSLDFDILATFGYLFSINLDASINSNKANVLADTTLFGLSGESIRFQNSSTYRYQELEVGEDGEVKSTGVTQEISTGLFMDITGWVSGDDMITMEISSTLSKKGTAANSTESSLPPTSERLINTHIRTPSGEPIIIGGLMQTEQNISREKTPFLGDIPLLGLLFQKNKVTEENTELVIYIVPYLDQGERSNFDPIEEIDRIYTEFFPTNAIVPQEEYL
ncbi:MAG: hypothetical protein JEY99_20610 [Spirochaetales bacterium]|nr:hypothetical protein [Spirochaetales bacterium]